MEALGIGLEALSSAISSIAFCGLFLGLGVIAATTFLISSGDITLEELKEFLKKDKKKF